MFKNALVSVSDKTDLEKIASYLIQQSCRIVSTGGTARYLKDKGIPVVEVSQITGFPEVFDGRVKTLHPHIHMSLLYRCQDDVKELKKKQLEPFDLVICNLYPFSKTLASGADDLEIIENIDIGGPSMIRAAAKNYKQILVLTSPKDYEVLITEKNSEDLRKKMAAQAFAHVAAYDSQIASWLGGENLLVSGSLVQELRYGENPQQKAHWYQTSSEGLHQLKVLQGKELSYNNLLDLDTVADFFCKVSKPTALAIKHTNPCAAVTSEHKELLIQKLFQSDPISIFGGILGLNYQMSSEDAEFLKDKFVECIWAPRFHPRALEILSQKKNLRLLEGDLVLTNSRQIKTINGGMLVQNRMKVESDTSQWKYFGQEPDFRILEDLKFAERVVALLKSNAISLVKDGQTLGLGMGQVNRVDAVEQAGKRLNKFFPDKSNIIMASDAFFPFSDSIDLAKKLGVSWILQPGGALRDNEVVAACEKYKINLVLTGARHFRH